MHQTCHLRLPIQRLGLAYPPIGPAEATRLLKLLLRPVLVAVVVVVLGWSLVVASHTIARVATGAVAPIVSAPLEGRALLMSEGDLQRQVDAYLADLDATRDASLP
jgi:hypothetical protein